MTPTQEHTEAAMESILRAVSTSSYEQVLLVETALAAGWLTEAERNDLTALRLAFAELLR